MQRCNDEVRRGGEKTLAASDAAGNGDGEAPCGPPGEDVLWAVTDHPRVLYPYAELADDRLNAVGSRLQRTITARENRTERGQNAELLEHEDADAAWLVGHERGRDAKPRAHLERLASAGQEAGVDDRTARVVLEEERGRPLEQRWLHAIHAICTACPKRPLREDASAVPDHRKNGVDRERHPADLDQRLIEGARNVALRVDERTVEIEKESAGRKDGSASTQAAAVYASMSRFSSSERRRDRARCSLERTALSVIERRVAIS